MDEAYKMAGGRGRYQLLVALASCVSLVSFMSFTFSVPYFLSKPTIECKSGDQWISCTYDDVCTDQRYTEYRFVEESTWNFNTEFGLLCKATDSDFINSAYFLGSIFSCLIVNTLSDIIGRLPVLIIANAGNIASLALLLLFPSYNMILAASALIGFLTIGSNSSSYSFVYESFTSNEAIFYGTIVSVSWSVAEVAIALIMWLGTSWRTMCFVLMGTSALFFIMLPWLRESPRFYFSKKRMDVALEKLKYVAAFNGKQLPEELELRSAGIQHAPGVQHSSVTKLFRAICCSGKMVVRTVLFSYSFCTSSFIFYAISLNINKMTANIYLLGLVTAVAEIVAIIFAGALLERLGKRISLSLYFAIAALGVFGQALTWDDDTWSVVFAYFTKFGSTAADSALYLFVAELFPTSIKGVAFGIAIFVARFSSMLSTPLSQLHYLLMYGIMMGLCLISTVVAVFMPIKADAAIEDTSQSIIADGPDLKDFGEAKAVEEKEYDDK